MQSPILFGICGDVAEGRGRGLVKSYEDMGHFEIYYGESFRIALRDDVRFLQENLPVEAGGEA